MFLKNYYLIHLAKLLVQYINPSQNWKIVLLNQDYQFIEYSFIKVLLYINKSIFTFSNSLVNCLKIWPFNCTSVSLNDYWGSNHGQIGIKQ